MPLTLRVCPEEALAAHRRTGVGSADSNEEIPLRARAHLPAPHPHHTGCSEQAGLTAAAFVQEETQKTTPKMQMVRHSSSYFNCRSPGRWWQLSG